MRRSLEDLLLEEKLVDEPALRLVRRAARKAGVALVRALVEDERIDDEALAALLARRLGLGRVDLAREAVDEDVIREVPFDLADQRRLLPLSIDRTGARPVMRVAMADPLDRDAIEELEMSTGCDVEPVIARVSALAEAARRYYRGLITQAIPRKPGFGGQRAAPTTQPRHQVADEAGHELRLEALVDLLVERGLVDRETFHEAVRKLVKRKAEG